MVLPLDDLQDLIKKLQASMLKKADHAVMIRARAQFIPKDLVLRGARRKMSFFPRRKVKAQAFWMRST